MDSKCCLPSLYRTVECLLVPVSSFYRDIRTAALYQYYENKAKEHSCEAQQGEKRCHLCSPVLLDCWPHPCLVHFLPCSKTSHANGSFCKQGRDISTLVMVGAGIRGYL